MGPLPVTEAARVLPLWSLNSLGSPPTPHPPMTTPRYGQRMLVQRVVRALVCLMRLNLEAGGVCRGVGPSGADSGFPPPPPLCRMTE